MTMTIEELRDLLDGFVAAGMGAFEFKMFLSNKDYGTCDLESVTVARKSDGNLVPTFLGTVCNA